MLTSAVIAVTLVTAASSQAQSVSFVCEAKYRGKDLDKLTGTYGFNIDKNKNTIVDSRGKSFTFVEFTENELYGKRLITPPNAGTRGEAMHIIINRLTAHFEIGLTYADGKDTSGSQFYNSAYTFNGQPQQITQIAMGRCQKADKLF